jgi:large subunit ribosomal protein L25
MADQITLRAQSGRTTGSRASRRLRREGQVPAIVYGRDVDDPINVAVNHHDLMVALSTEAGTNALITLDLGSDTVLTMPRVVERHPFRNEIRHVDFVTVSLTERVSAEVHVHFEGEPVGVREGGVPSYARTTVYVEALPAEIPTSISLDISDLDIGDNLRVEDLPAIEGVEYLDEPEAVIVSVTVPRALVEEEAEAEEAEGEELLEGEEEGEEAEEAEGESAAE